MKLHPLLVETFADLEQAEIRWCLLRIPSNPAAPSGDVDLLIDPDHLASARRLLLKRGFIPLPGWDDGTTLLCLAYHAPTDQWLWLDIATTVSFGGVRATGSQEEPGYLARRERVDGMVVLGPNDAFWALLLHCLIDKRSVPVHYRARLQALAADADSEAPLAKQATAVCPPWRAHDLLERTRHGNWMALERLAPTLATQWTRQGPPARRVRDLAASLVRFAGRPWLLPRRRGLSVALLGANGAGKSTLADGLERSFGFPVRQVYMGLWRKGDAPPGGVELPWLDALGRPFKAWWRYGVAQYHQCLGRLVIFDRYTYDALQPPQPPYVWLKRPYFWMLAHICPPPDLVLVLDVPGTVSFDRKGEYPPEELEAERRHYLGLSGRVPQLVVVDATRTRDVVRVEAVEEIWRRYAARWAAN